MKLTELKCTACNGTLKIDESNPHIAVCEYCKSRYVIEDEDEDNVRLESTVQPIPYIPATPKTVQKSGWGTHGWKKGMAFFMVGMIVTVSACLTAIIWRWVDYESAVPATEFTETKEEQKKKLPEKTVVPLTGALALTAEEVFGHPADQVTSQELAKIQWMAARYSDGGSILSVGYSFDNPYAAKDANLTWLSFSRDDVAEFESDIAKNAE